jgi:hypothetical protein
LSSRILLNNFIAPATVSNKKSANQATSSEEFPNFVSAVTARETAPEDSPGYSSPQDSNGGSSSEASVLTETATGSSLPLQPDSGTKSLVASQSAASNLEGFQEQNDSFTSNYGQPSLDTSVMGKSLLKLIQSVQEGDIPQAQSALSQISQKISDNQSLSSTNSTFWYTATNPLQRFVSEMQTTLSDNNIQDAQASLSSFLESIGQTKGNFVSTSV